MAKREIPAVVVPPAPQSRRWGWTAIGLVGIAQAAAILLVVGLNWRSTTTDDVAVTPAVSRELLGPKNGNGPAAIPVFEIDEGRMVVIHCDASAPQVVDLTPQTASYRLDDRLRTLESAAVDDWLYMLNEAEALTKPLVAMKE